MTKTKPMIVLAILLIAVISANAKQADETAKQSRQIELKVGKSVTGTDGLKVSFLSLDGDSRCPEGVQCIWAGNAAVTIEIGKAGAPSETVALNTQIEPRGQTYLGYEVALLSLVPHPKADGVINKDEYIATFEITSKVTPAPKAFSEPAGVPLELRLISKQTHYTLDLGGKTEADFTAQLNPKSLRPKLPPPTKVDLEVELKNTGTKTLQVWTSGDATRLDLNLQGDGAVSVDSQLMFTMEFRMPKAVSLMPGQSWTMPIRELSYGHRGVEKRAYWTKPGNYTLTASFSTAVSPAPEGAQKTGDNDEFGQVKFVSAPLRLVVLAKGQNPGPVELGWQNLFSEEKWYRDQVGDEQKFFGILQAVPKNGEATILMRDSFYKLGDRTIYTGAKTHPNLDELVGKQVEIKGKAVDMELEGQALNEIWPAQIRVNHTTPRLSAPF